MLYSFPIIAFSYCGCGKWSFLGVLKPMPLYFTPNNIEMIKSQGMKLGRYIALIENKRIVYRILVENVNKDH
jgi:hypothetical protein